MELIITNTKGERFTVLYDEIDHEKISQFKWYVAGKKNKYARTNHEGKKIMMHRLIMGAILYHQIVDHKDHNTLDNRRNNLRICTSQQNQRNRTNKGKQKYKGVTWNPDRNKWQVSIKTDNEILYIGRFIDEELAARIYDVAAKMYHGEFAFLNFPNS